MRDSTFTKFCILCGIMLCALFIEVSTMLKDEEVVVDAESTTSSFDIIKTVDHVSLDDSSYELIYSNPDEDIAYYRYIGKRDTVKVGDKVYTDSGVCAKVLRTSNVGFEVEYDGSFYPGMSGTPIRDESGVVVGYVSALINSEYVTCIYSIVK